MCRLPFVFSFVAPFTATAGLAGASPPIIWIYGEYSLKNNTSAKFPDHVGILDALDKVLNYRRRGRSCERPFTFDNYDALNMGQAFISSYRADGVIGPVFLEDGEK